MRRVTRENIVVEELVGDLERLDASYDGRYDDHLNMLKIRRAMFALLKDWYCSPSEWIKLGIKAI
jgi:hypothetical protein